MIRLSFVQGRGLGSALIRWKGAGSFSHVDAVRDDGWLVGARFDTHGKIPPGVQARPPDYETWKLRVVFEIPATAEQTAAFWGFINAQMGKPYDWLAIISFAIRRNWRTEDAWFCSELIAAALEYAGIVEKLYAPACKIDPVSLSTVVSSVGGRKFETIRPEAIAC